MNALAWIKPLIAAQGLDVPPELDRMIGKGVQDQEPFRFTTVDRGTKDTERMNSMFPAHFAPKSEGSNRGRVWELHHDPAIGRGGSVYDLSKITVVTPQQHGRLHSGKGQQ